MCHKTKLNQSQPNQSNYSYLMLTIYIQFYALKQQCDKIHFVDYLLGWFYSMSTIVRLSNIGIVFCK